MINMCDIHTMILNWLIGLVRRVIGLIVSRIQPEEETYQQLELNK